MENHEHFLEQHDPDRKDFQIDRIILFTDAVFAIAITLLIIEVKAPEVHGLTNSEILQQLSGLIPKFAGFIISFFVIAVYWRSHHRIFGFLNNFSDKLIWINMLFLFSIVLMPFSSAYYSENVGYNIPYIFYNVNIAITGIINYWMMRYVFNPDNKLTKHQPTPVYVHLYKSRALAIPLFFLSATLLSSLPYGTTPIIYFFLWPVLYIIKIYNTKKFGSLKPVAGKLRAKRKT